VGPDPRKTVESTDQSQYCLFIESLDSADYTVFESSNVKSSSLRVIVNRDNRPENYLAGTVIRDIAPAVGVYDCGGK
jgi:hypothetical protein